MKDKSGVTLIELVMVVVVVGILATIALPTFQNAREHAFGREAIANLRLIAAAERIYRMETGQYYGPQATMGDINTVLRLSLPTASQNWNYAITARSDTPAAFTLQAQRAGGATGCTYGLTQDQADPVVTGGNCP